LSELPSGTVTFLFTDIEGSTRLWEEHRDAMEGALARHDEIVRAAVVDHHGHVVKTTGDGFHCAFATAHDCLRAAALAQATLESTAWPDEVRVRVRMGVHTGEVQERDGDYYGPAANRAARLMGLAYGGQIVVSGASHGIVADSVDGGFELVALGDARVRGVPEPIAVYQLAGPGLARDFPPLVTATEFVGNLSAAVSSFLGRHEEIADVVDLLADARMVTLTGVGGVGKTRMALEVAAQAAPGFRDGAWVVELARVRDPDAVGSVISAALRAANRPELDPIDALVEFLASKEILVVLDNCEHLLDGIARVVRALLPQCERVRILATSREGLAIRGDRIVAVPSLEPETASELFVERAHDANGSFDPTPADLDAIAELCARLDGIPLAIELAAARITALSPAQIAARLDQRFRLLAGGERGAVERHATLRAAIDWSYDLLSAPEQVVLGRLSVFAGPCTLEAAEAVCSGGEVEIDDVLDCVSSLVARSLVVASTDGADPAYGLLETIRQYAEERVDPGELTETRDRHAAYYAAFVERAALALQSSEQPAWIRRVERETENVRVAFAWALERERSDDVVAMVRAAMSNPLTSFTAVEIVFDRAEDAVAVLRRYNSDGLPAAVAVAAWSACNRGDFDRGDAHVAEAEALCSDPDDLTTLAIMQTRMLMATVARDIEAASALEQRMVEWARRNDAPYELAAHLVGLSAQQATLGRRDLSLTSAQEALDVARANDDVLALPGALTALALAVLDDDPDAARQHLVEAEAVWERYPDLPASDVGHLLGAIVAANIGDESLTLNVCDRAFRYFMAGRLSQAVVTEALAGAIAARAPESSCTLYGVVEMLSPELAKFGAMAVTRARATEHIDAQLDAAQVTALRARGGALTPLQAVDYARSCIDEGLATYE
jgi:predicted ATPase/class 3 adenylate cyclase